MQTREFRYCRALYQVAVAINSSLDPGSVLSSIAESVALATGARGCSLMLLSPDRRELRYSAGYGPSDWYVRKGSVRVSTSMTEALKGRSVAVLEAGTDPWVQCRDQATRENIASMLSVPVRFHDRVIGVMCIYTAEPREFSAQDVEFVEAAANLGAIALENARRFEEVRSDFDEVRRYIYGGTQAIPA